MPPKFLKSIWFTNRDGTIGIVKVDDDFFGIKYYIGTTHAGYSEEADAQHIVAWGTRFPKDAGDALFGFAS